MTAPFDDLEELSVDSQTADRVVERCIFGLWVISGVFLGFVLGMIRWMDLPPGLGFASLLFFVPTVAITIHEAAS